MQKNLQGTGCFQQMQKQVSNDGYRNVFFIAGNHFMKDNPVLFEGLPVTRFTKEGTNVTNEEIDIAFSEYKKELQQVIVAVGGGSVIDLAKGIIYRCIDSSIRAPFFVAVPTTAGSGSEATHFAVVYKNKRKISLAHPSLLPSLAVLDPVLTYSLPPFQTAASGIDTLSQAIESYWCGLATAGSKRCSEESIQLWQQYFLQVVADPQPRSREKMLYAAYLAGKAIDTTRTTGPHALSYYLTAEHGVAHGQAVGIFLPIFFIYNKPQPELCAILHTENEKEAMVLIQSKMKQAGLATNFAELRLDKNSILNDLLASVNEERFANNPVPFNPERLKKLFTQYL